MNQSKPMLSVRQALDFLLAAARPIKDTEMASTLDANCRVLAAAQSSRLNVPPMDNTQMDGYAVRAADCAGGAARLPVAQRIPAGYVGQQLQPGTADSIFTGAMIPEGADAVDMHEMCEEQNTDEGDFVTFRHVAHSGVLIRLIGEVIRSGSSI